MRSIPTIFSYYLVLSDNTFGAQFLPLSSTKVCLFASNLINHDLEIINILYLLALGEFGCIAFSLVNKKRFRFKGTFQTFIFFDQINQIRYKRSITVGNNYTLSQRYQLAENIRSANLMRKSIVLYTVFNSIIMLVRFNLPLIIKQCGKPCLDTKGKSFVR